MTANEAPRRIPMEVMIAGGIALSMSDQFLVIFAALIVWLALRNAKPGVSADLLLAASLRLGLSLLASVAVAMGLVPPSTFIEVGVVGAIALLLFVTEIKAFAYLLILYSGLQAIVRAFGLQEPNLTAHQQQVILGQVAIQALMVWMLICYLRNPKPSVAGFPPVSPADDPFETPAKDPFDTPPQVSPETHSELPPPESV